MRFRRFLPLLLIAAVAVPTAAFAQESKLVIGGTTYTKWLWGNQRDQGSLYNFTTVPGEGWGDNGQGSEVELLLNAKLSKQVEVKARIHSRFSQNQWTNFGGFGGSLPPVQWNDNNGSGVFDAGDTLSYGSCVGGECGEFDSRSNQYVKLRGVTVILTPGYKWIDTATIGANDWGMFDPFTIGRIRYIDRDNGAGLLFQGSAAGRKFTWDFARISLPKLWAGPSFNTGDYHVQDAAYGAQFKWNVNSMFDVAAIFQYVNDLEVKAEDVNLDNGRDVRTRFNNFVAGLKFGVRPTDWLDIRGAYYDSTAESTAGVGGAPGNFFGISGFSPVPAGELDDQTWRLNADFNDPFGIGLSFQAELFDIGADYVSMMAARRESDVLLTEGSDSAFAMPGPSNAAFGVFGGNPTKIGYGGWQGNAQQVATINVDNEFSDFDEPMAESAIGWKGFTLVPIWTKGALELQAELSFIDYNTNWQAWGHPERAILDSLYPNQESDAGVFGGFRNAYAPFQDKETEIYLIKGKYVLDAGKGIDLFGKIKMIDETDKRMNDATYLPYAAGDCPGGGVACGNVTNEYAPGLSTAALYGNPGLITVGADTGYQWKPFDDLADDDKELDYMMFQLGAGYQLTDDLYASMAYEKYDVDLLDGNTAFQAYQLHEMASGQHDKNKFIVNARYILAGAEFGLIYEYAWGDFTPDFGGGYVPNVDAVTGDRFFNGRFGGTNSLETREFRHNHLKAFMKVQF